MACSLSPCLWGSSRYAARADLVETKEQVHRVLVDAVRACRLQLVHAVAAGEAASLERAGTARDQQMPDTVSDHYGVHSQPPGSGLEQVRVRQGVRDLVSCNHRHAVQSVADRDQAARVLAAS